MMAAHWAQNLEIAAQLGTSRQTVGLWRRRFLTKGLAGIAKDAPRGGRPPRQRRRVEALIVETTTQTKPPHATQWTTRRLAAHLGVSHSMVQRIWKAYDLKPHRVRTFKLSNDPRFLEKLEDVVGLYLNPPELALALSADEKSQIQALDRTRPDLPLRPGRCGTMTHDYKRHGTTTLFAALELPNDKVISTCMARHRHQEWIKFLKLIDAQTPADLDLHVIADNYATHKHPKVKAWLARHSRFHIHFIPTSSSWLNLVERFFRDLTDKQIRRSAFTSVADLIAAIETYISAHNDHPRPFVWAATVQQIIAKVGRARTCLDKTTSA